MKAKTEINYKKPKKNKSKTEKPINKEDESIKEDNKKDENFKQDNTNFGNILDYIEDSPKGNFIDNGYENLDDTPSNIEFNSNTNDNFNMSIDSIKD